MSPAPPPATRRRAGERGMSLVELMVALVVLAFGVLGVAALFPLGSENSIDDRLLTQAVELAQQQMEVLRMRKYSDPELTPGWHPGAGGEPVGPNGRFTRRYFVQQVVTGLVDAKAVQVEVTWAATRPDTVRLVTYFKR